MSEHEDVWLKDLLEERTLPDDGFSLRVTSRLNRRRALHRGVWFAGLGLMALFMLFGWLAPIELSSAPAPSSQLLQVLPALLIALGLCGALWVDTEPFGPLI